MVQKGKKISTAGRRVSTRLQALKGLVSVVIPVEPEGSVAPALKALQNLPPAEKALIRELLVAEGLHPSRQRNVAVAEARAPWILFLDSDSQLQAGSLPALLRAGQALQADGVGGPNLPLHTEPFWGRVFQDVIGSWLGSMASRARYENVGVRRLSSEKELILCNLLVKRELFDAGAGFREDLYPNEENELFNRLQSQGRCLVYEPLAQVLRPRRHDLFAFSLQAFRYGRGRTQQMRANFFRSDLINLLPLALGPAWILLMTNPVARPVALALLAGLVTVGALGAWLRVRPWLYLPVLGLRHHAYALGLLVGVFQNTPRRPLTVQVKRPQW